MDSFGLPLESEVDMVQCIVEMLNTTNAWYIFRWTQFRRLSVVNEVSEMVACPRLIPFTGLLY